MKHIKVLGITGSVGAGKSTILTYLEKRYGARVIQLDKVAHMLMEPGQKCYEKIVEFFGTDILNEDGTICRLRLYENAFSAKERLEKLNGIVHPCVKEWVKDAVLHEREEGNVPFIVVEAALLLEDHYEEICDQIWFVYVDRMTRIDRLRASRGYSVQKTKDILSNQKTDDEFRRLCQFEVDNSSDILENTYEQIDRGLKEHGFL